jgi:hypothetical protein
MTEEHPITPSIELVKQWSDRWHSAKDNDFDVVLFVAIEAARWGSNQELEACCKWLPKLPPWSADDLRRHRRPKPPSLKELAQAELDRLIALIPTEGAMAMAEPIRRALEKLDD